MRDAFRSWCRWDCTVRCTRSYSDFIGKYEIAVPGAPEYRPRYEPQRLAKPDTAACTSIPFCISSRQQAGACSVALVSPLPTRPVQATEGRQRRPPTMFASSDLVLGSNLHCFVAPFSLYPPLPTLYAKCTLAGRCCSITALILFSSISHSRYLFRSTHALAVYHRSTPKHEAKSSHTYHVTCA